MELMNQLLTAPFDFMKDYGLPFLVVLTVLVFVHEFGHYYVARRCGVRVESFSIGFGKELFGRMDKHGTRWSFRLIPLGGYVQMFGDVDPASAKHEAKVTEGDVERPMTDAEKKEAFFAQPIGKRAAIVFAGPAINYIFAIIILAALYIVQGQPFTPPVAAQIVEGSPAEKAGIKPDEKILSVDGEKIERFEELKQAVVLKLDQEVVLEVVSPIKKKGVTVEGQWEEKSRIVRVKPEVKTMEDRFGFKHATGLIGIKSPQAAIETQQHTVVTGIGAAIYETYRISRDTLKSLGQIVMGVRSSDELGGILRIGAYAGQFAQNGIISFVTFAALLSVNLGLINLLPIPMLDGGHLVMYAMEKTRGKPLGEKTQEYALRVGMLLLLSMMVFATWNDIVQLKIVDYVAKLVS